MKDFFSTINQEQDDKDFGSIALANHAGASLCAAALNHAANLTDAQRAARADNSRKSNASLVAEGPGANALLFRGTTQGINN